MRICVIGTGYVGLVAGACFSDMGNKVICVDNDEDKINGLSAGKISIYEPGLEELVKSGIAKKTLEFTCDIDYAVKNSDICFITVGTPQDYDGSADLSHILNVVKDIAKSMNSYKIIVNKSTVPVGSTEKMMQLVKDITNQKFDIVSNPEFLKQGSAVRDFLYPDRVIIGSNSDSASKTLKDLYSPFFRTKDRMLIMDIKSAEMTKYCANTFLATKISFMNEIANLCEKTGANIENVRKGISSDERIGNQFLFAGIGYGGSCFPKDVKALIKTGSELGIDMKIVKAVNETNINQRQLFLDKIYKYFNYELKGKVVAVWGLSFKPKTNDMREAPSITIINELLKKGAIVKAYDPKALCSAKNIFKDEIKYSASSYEALDSADCLLLLTEWNEFRHPDFVKMKQIMKSPVIFDGRNQYDTVNMRKYGFEYYCIGK